MVTLELISPENIDALSGLSVRLWPDSALSEMKEHYSELMTIGKGTCYLLKEGERYIGFIELSLRSDYVEGSDDSPVPYIEGIFVTEEYRRNGLAQMLLHRAEEWAVSKGYTQLCSDTEWDNQLGIQLHLAAGFEEVSRNISFVKRLG